MRESKGTTRYGMIATLMKKRIYSGEWQPGSVLPAESVLAKQYAVALGTVRQAIDMLVAEKLLVKHHGRGTFVSTGLSSHTTLRFFKFGQAITPDSPPVSHVTSCAAVKSNAGHRALFGADCARLIHVERVRLLGNVPRVQEQIWLPLPLFDALLELDPHCLEERLYPLYARQCQVTIVNAIDDISVEPLPASIAAQLELPAGNPGVSIKRRSIDILGRIVEYRVAVGDAYQFTFSGEAG